MNCNSKIHNSHKLSQCYFCNEFTCFDCIRYNYKIKKYKISTCCSDCNNRLSFLDEIK